MSNTTQPSDLQLQLALAKALPEVIAWYPPGSLITPFHSGIPFPAPEGWFSWKDTGNAVTLREWDWVVREVENLIPQEQNEKFLIALVEFQCQEYSKQTKDKLTDFECAWILHQATWQQRAITLAAIGVIKVEE